MKAQILLVDPISENKHYGECGQEYVKPDEVIPCRKENEALYWKTEKCCEELEPTFRFGQPICKKKLNFFQKLWRAITSIF